jgi:TolA-binding protein
MRRVVALITCCVVVSGALAAQEIAPGTPPPVFRAIERALLQGGRGEHAQARQALDSLVAQLPSGSEAMVEALFWRATLAADGVDAERDYRRLLVERPLSSRAEEALFRLAEYEIVRGRLAEGRALLQQLYRDYSAPGSQARTAYWLARSWFDVGEDARGCTALAEARARAPGADSALRVLITRWVPRCPSPRAP